MVDLNIVKLFSLCQRHCCFMLTRGYFALFAAGFSLCMIIKQLSLVYSDPSKRKLGLVLLLWSIYITIQLIDQWSLLEQRDLPGIAWALYISTIFYSACVTWLLHISMQRYTILTTGI